MKVKSPDGQVFEMNMDPTPEIPITVDHTRYNELIDLLWKYVDKYERYSKYAYERADEFIDHSTLNDAECFGANDAEGCTYDHVVRDLRHLISSFQ